MLRRLWNLLLFLPIPLLFLVLYLSARSYLPEHLFFRWYQGKLIAFFVSGQYAHWFDRSKDQYLSTREIIVTVKRMSPPSRAPQGQLIGFEWAGIDFKADRPGMFSMPSWALATPLAIASVWWVITQRRRRVRNLPGHCGTCGYDLRASSGKCPECGASAPTNGEKIIKSDTPT
jgi:hypothetical protein